METETMTIYCQGVRSFAEQDKNGTWRCGSCGKKLKSPEVAAALDEVLRRRDARVRSAKD